MIKIKEISKVAENRMILDRITCEICDGLTFITGDSGAGKTTFLNLIGMIDSITTGEIAYFGKDYKYESSCENKDYFRASHFGWVFQESNLISGLTVKENIDIAASLSSTALPEKDTLLLLNNFNLDKLSDKKIDVLSGGEKQRIAIVRALAKGADIILADEPTGNLDSENSEIVFKTLKAIAKDRTVIVVTHNIEKAYEYGDHIIHIRDGKIIDDKWISSRLSSSPENDADSYTPEKRKLANQYIKLLSKNNFSKSLNKIRSIVFTSSLAMASAGIIFSLGKTVSSQINEMNYTYYDADIVNVMPDYSDPSAGMIVSAAQGTLITAEDIKHIEDTGYFKEIVPMVSWPLYIADTFCELHVKYFSNESYFTERYGKTDIVGEFPVAGNEIVLGKDIAEDYFGDRDTAIGNTICLENDYGNAFFYNIVGINEHKTIDGIYYNYILTDSIIGETYKDYNSELYDAETFMSDNVTFTSCASGVCEPCFDDLDVVIGRKPVNNGEIVISTSAFAELADCLFGGGVKKYNDWDFQNLNGEQKRVITDAFAREYLIGANKTYNAQIVGLYNDASDVMYGAEDWINTIYRIEPMMVQCYTGDLDIAKKYDEFIFPQGLTYNSYYEERFSTAIEMGNMWKLILFAVVALVIILTSVMINAFTKISITQRLYELGILKALGSSSEDLVHLLLYDSFYMGILSGFVAVILYLFAICILPIVFKIKIESRIIVTVTGILIFALPVCAYVLMTYGKIKNASKQLPINLIRSSR